MHKRVFVLGWIVLWLSACSAPSISPTNSPFKTAAPAPVTPTPISTPSATPQPTDTAVSIPVRASVAVNDDEQRMFNLINAERARTNLRPLKIDPTFQAVARARSADMAARQYYSHYDPATGELAAKAMLLRLGVTTPMGENYYANWPYNLEFVAKAMQWFIDDPPHRRNILSPLWTVCGVGVVAGQGNVGITVQVFGQR